MAVCTSRLAERSCVCFCTIAGVLLAPGAVQLGIGQKPDSIGYSANCPPIIGGGFYTPMPEDDFICLILLCPILIALVVSAGRATFYYAGGEPTERASTTIFKWVGVAGVVALLWWAASNLGYL